MKPLPKLKCKGPECMGCSAAKCYFEGGDVYDIEREEKLFQKKDRSPKGVHRPTHSDSGMSEAGYALRRSPEELDMSDEDRRATIKGRHHMVLSQMKSMKKPHGEFAHGGEVDEHEMAPHDEAMEMKDILGDEDPVLDMIGDEFLKAIESKNKKELLDSIIAMVLTTK